MSTNKIAACIILLAACGDAEERDCAVGQDTQNGLYELRLTQHGGDCGRVWESIETEIVDGAPMPPDDRAGCSLNVTNWEPNSCTTRTNFDCNDAAFWETDGEFLYRSFVSQTHSRQVPLLEKKRRAASMSLHQYAPGFICNGCSENCGTTLCLRQGSFLAGGAWM